MARPIRIEYEGAVYHVTARGNERRAIFRDDADRERFLESLGESATRFGMSVHAYCLMPNHYHLLAQTPRGNLSRAIGWLQTTYTIRFNRRHGRSGHLMQGRFKAHLVEADAYGRELVKYIHLNPVRPRDRRKAIPAERRGELQRYRWSSHRGYAGTAKGPEWLSLEWLGYWGAYASVAREAYRRDMASCFGSPVPSPWAKLRGGLVLGGESLWEKVAAGMKVKKGVEEIRWRRREGYESVRRVVREWLDREPDDRVRIWMRVKFGGERPADLAREQGYSTGSGVIKVVERLERRAMSDRALAVRMKKYASAVGNV